MPPGSFPPEIAHNVLKQGHGPFACSFEQFKAQGRSVAQAIEATEQQQSQQNAPESQKRKRDDSDSNENQRPEKRAKNEPSQDNKTSSSWCTIS